MPLLDKQNRAFIEIANNLDGLVALGTLNFYNIPLFLGDLNDLPVNNSHWRWFNIGILVSSCKQKNLPVHPILEDILFLITFRYCTATYRTFYINGCLVAKVRLYAIPNDVKDAHHINSWRASRPKYLNLQKNFARTLFGILDVADFSRGSWSKFDSGVDNLVFPIIPIPLEKSDLNLVNDSNISINRWCNSEPFKLTQASPESSIADKISTIYNGIRSPDVSKYYSKSKPKESASVPTPEETIVELIHNLSDGVCTLPGVKTTLYPFQIKSICKMFEKEAFIESDIMPNFIKIKSPTGKIYYFDLMNSAILLQPEVFQLPRGGILAENMGSGKTLICLSLICLTKWEISQQPPDYLVYKEDDVEELEEMAFDGDQYVPSLPRYKPLKKLTDICKDKIVSSSLPWRYYIKDIPESVAKMLSRSPGHFKIPLENSEYLSPFRIKRSRQSERTKYQQRELPMEGRTFRSLYYCNTTLTIVPDNLFHQWNTELKKHIQGSYLKKLFISSQFKKQLQAENSIFSNSLDNMTEFDLINFDLIVVSYSVFARQFDKKAQNILLRVYWKRLIIDEGHSLNSKNSRISLLCRELHSERRWAVTGTPTSGMTRLHMDEEEDDDDVTQSPSKKKKYMVKNQFNEKDDLIKLGNLVSNFLKIEPFSSQPRIWSGLIIRPIFAFSFGSLRNLSNLLNAVVVRHSLEDVERDIKLPQLHHVPVFLKPSFHNKLAINIFTSVLAVNAVSSERKDIDYMFHPSNRMQLRRLITNLQRATFHWTGFKQEDIETLISICEKSLKKTDENGQSSYNRYDIELLEKSMEMAKKALNTPSWRTIALLHEMNYYISGLPDIFTKAFGTGVVESMEKGVHNDISIFGAPHLNALQDFFYKNRFTNFNDDNSLVERLESISKPFWSNYWKNTIKKNTQKFNKHDKENPSDDILQQRVIDAMEYDQPKSPPRKKKKVDNKKKPDKKLKYEKKIEELKIVNDSKRQLERDEGDGLKITNEINTLYSIAKHNLSYDQIKNAIILGTASSKLSYLAAKLLQDQHRHVKSIVFFEFEDSAYYLTEMLDILGINYILYATFINPAQRASNLSEFSDFDSQMDGGITLIMDLRLASHGLTIIAATKVYFISPVWQRSVEAQAIKRAHRIGQTRDVYVETLVLEETLEEEIYKRRQRPEKDTDDQTKKYVIDDYGMQEYILRHKFLPFDPDEKEYAPLVTPSTTDKVLVEPEIDADPAALNVHSDKIIADENGSLQRQWNVHLFNKDNLAKLNSAKNQKITREYFKEQFVKNFVEDEERPAQMHTRVKSGNPSVRKTVRF